jgi:3-mercaptopyruvate sulfurtransferase SseA
MLANSMAGLTGGQEAQGHGQEGEQVMDARSLGRYLGQEPEPRPG